MKKDFTVKLKTILMRHVDKRKRRKPGRRVTQMAKYMIMKRKLANRDKIATTKMPSVLLYPLEKSIVIPDDVILEILVKLTARSVGRFRCVCKSWLSITTNLSFIRAHTQHNHFTNQSLIIERLKIPREGYYLASADSNTELGITLCKLHGISDHNIIASCDGLLYLSYYYDDYIINPLTGHSISLPPGKGTFLGFYFHRSTSKYRIIQGRNDIVVMTDVLVVGERFWRHLPCRLPCHLPPYHQKSLDLNGHLFWLAFKEGSQCRQPNTIIAFDTEAEIYSLLSLPPSEKLLNIIGNLVDFNGELGLWVADNKIIDVWIMEECWVRRYSINYFDLTGCSARFCRLKHRWVGGAAVFLNDKDLLIDVSEARYLIRCNLKSGACCFHPREIDCGGMWIGRSYPYVETLVYPDCFLT